MTHKIASPVSSDTNKGLDSPCSEPADTSFVLQQNEEENSQEEEQRKEKERANESGNEFNDEDVKQEMPPDKTPLERKKTNFMAPFYDGVQLPQG